MVILAAALKIATLVIGPFLAVALIGAASAHDQHLYDMACCDRQDCKPVADGVVEEKADGVHIQGHGIVNRLDPRLRTSRDDRDHLCIRGGKMICVYRKPNGT